MVISLSTAVRSRRTFLTALALTAALFVATPSAQPAFASAAPTAATAAAPCDYEQDPYQCNYLYLYPQTGFGDDAQRLPHQPDNTCAELPWPLTSGLNSFQNRLGSFGRKDGVSDVPGQAVLLFAGAGCTGASKRFSSGSSSRDMTALGFATAVSVRFIADPCEVYVDAAGKGKNLNVCVYADAGDVGTFQAFPSQPANTCLALQSSLLGQVTAVRNNLYNDDPAAKLQQDVLLFAGDNCTGAAERFNASTGYPDLSYLDFDNRARSIKFVVDPCKYGTSLCLWANVLYDGAAQVIVAPVEGSCVNLSTALKGQVTSYRNQLTSPDRQDVAFFAADNCTGATKRIDALTASSDLSEIAFDNKIRSVRFVTDSCRWGTTLCLYTGAYHEGEVQVIKNPTAAGCTNLRTGISGQVSSIRNWLTGTNSYFDVEIYVGTGCTGATRTLWAGNVDFNLVAPFENGVKSVKLVRR